MQSTTYFFVSTVIFIIAVILGVLFFCRSALGLVSAGGVFSGFKLWGRLQQDNKSLPLPDFERPAIQQDNNYKEFMSWITDGGLRYAVAKHKNDMDADKFYRKKVAKGKRRHVIVIGAGMAGLSAAYELAQSGGAMRLPYNHYLTKHYIELFNVETRTFKNYNENTFLYIYGEKITTKEWEENNKRYTNKWWPGWDANYPRKLKKTLKIEGILSLYDLTVQPVMEELGAQPTEAQWQAWIEKWSTLSLEDFLRTTTYQKDDQPQLRPWTEEAIQAFATSTYITPLLQESLVFWLREDLGQWWKEPMYAPTNGMDSLPKAFMNKNEAGWNKDVDLSKNIVYGVKVDKVVELVSGRVQVKGTNIYTGLSVSVEGDAVFLALPLPILRQLDIPLSVEKQKAMASITYESSTKILLQCKTRFWQNTVGKGGASKTNMQIGQLVYPGHNGDGITRNERGILVVYTWNQEALTFGAMSDKDAIASAVRQISKIHPEMVSQFEVGKVQAWHSDPSALGAFAGLKPYEYMNAFKALIKPTETIYMAGEAMSWSSTWIQGAVFSGLMQAYSFQEYLETDTITSPKDILL